MSARDALRHKGHNLLLQPDEIPYWELSPTQRVRLTLNHEKSMRYEKPPEGVSKTPPAPRVGRAGVRGCRHGKKRTC